MEKIGNHGIVKCAIREGLAHPLYSACLPLASNQIGGWNHKKIDLVTPMQIGEKSFR
jgi:hypothetical protein